MARQIGLIKLKGTLDNVNFYKSKDGNMARMKTSVDGARIASDPAFIRTRENGAEFGAAASSGKLLRDTLRTVAQHASDGRVSSRLTKVMTQVKNLDLTSNRGERNVGVGIVDPAAKMLFKGFNFNNRAILGSILFRPYTLDNATGVIEINDFSPINDIAIPTGATHATFRGAWAKVDFVTGVGSMEVSNSVNLDLSGSSSNITLTPANTPTGSGTDVFVLLIEFFQKINGTQYTLKNGAFNALSIIEVQ